MTTEIEIFGAVFRCATEREIFLQRLAEIAGLQKMVIEEEKVILTVSSDQESGAMTDLHAICDVWSAAYRLRSAGSQAEVPPLPRRWWIGGTSA